MGNKHIKNANNQKEFERIKASKSCKVTPNKHRSSFGDDDFIEKAKNYPNSNNKEFSSNFSVNENKVNDFQNNEKHIKENFIFSINQYKVERLIGKGYYSKVYLAFFEENVHSGNTETILTYNKKYVAVKSISKKKILEKKSIEYILNEKNILKNLNFENLTKLICTAQNEKKIFMIIEYHKNGDLFNYLNQYKFFEEDIVKFIMIQVYHSLRFLHSKNIIYRDLKPENIMISDEGFIKLIDFGLAKQLSNENEKVNDVCGTNEYIPPEVVSKMKYSFNFDWWGFGILMFELLIGKPPFRGRSQNDIFNSIKNDPINFDFSNYYSAASLNYIYSLNINGSSHKYRNSAKKTLSDEAKDILSLLLKKDLEERIDPEEILYHPFFSNYNYQLYSNREAKSPLMQMIKNINIPKFYFDDCSIHNDKVKSKKKRSTDSEIVINQSIFVDF